MFGDAWGCLGQHGAAWELVGCVGVYGILGGDWSELECLRGCLGCAWMLVGALGGIRGAPKVPFYLFYE